MNKFDLVDKKTGKVVNVVQTPRTAAQVQEMYPGYTVKEASDGEDNQA